jgi:hypothetical protein
VLVLKVKCGGFRTNGQTAAKGLLHEFTSGTSRRAKYDQFHNYSYRRVSNLVMADPPRIVVIAHIRSVRPTPISGGRAADRPLDRVGRRPVIHPPASILASVFNSATLSESATELVDIKPM